MTRRKAITVYLMPELDKQIKTNARKTGVSESKFIADHMARALKDAGETPLGVADNETVRVAVAEIVRVVRAESFRLTVAQDVFLQLFLQHTPAPEQPAEGWQRRATAATDLIKGYLSEEQTNGN
jgi:hypothetical protein